MGATRLASEKIQLLFSRVRIIPPFSNPDARRVAPISACVFCNKTSLIFDADFERPTFNPLTQKPSKSWATKSNLLTP